MEIKGEETDQKLSGDEIAGAMIACDMVYRACKSLADPSYIALAKSTYQSMIKEEGEAYREISEREFCLVSVTTQVVAYQFVKRFQELFKMLGIGQSSDGN